MANNSSNNIVAKKNNHLKEVNHATLANALTDTSVYTPMIQHFLTVKAKHPNQLLFYRMGDFYELFFDDAIKAAELLGITLTRRGKDPQGADIPMAGVPYHAAESYLARLVKMGETVVICEQVADVSKLSPNEIDDKTKTESNTENKTQKSKTSKSSKAQKLPMQRDVVRIITPGTLTDDALMMADKSQKVMAIYENAKKTSYGIATLELSAGKLCIQEVPDLASLDNEVSRIWPAEIIVHEDALYQSNLSADLSVSVSEKDQTDGSKTEKSNKDTFASCLMALKKQNYPISKRPSVDFNSAHAKQTLCQQLSVNQLDGFGEQVGQMTAAITAGAALVHYAKETQKCALPHLKTLTVESSQDFLILDAATRKNLELLTPQFAHGVSLLKLVNHCSTPMGKRELANQIAKPLTNQQHVNSRLDTIDTLLIYESTHHTVTQLQTHLKAVADVERISARIALKTARPRDLAQLKQSCDALPTLLMLLSTCLPNPLNANKSTDKPEKTALEKIKQHLAPLHGGLDQVQTLLEAAIIDNPPVLIRDGGVIASGYDKQLDKLQHIRDNTNEHLKQLEIAERERSGINSLKISYNKVSGFFYELSRSQSENVPAHFIRRQTLKNTERFITSELKSYEDKVLSSASRALEREKQLYNELLGKLEKHLISLQKLSQALAKLDVFCNWARIAYDNHWVRPELTQNTSIDIKAGRHPVIEMHRDSHFTPNDVCLNQQQKLLLITGPNMGGKSTFMRQTALICILAYCGSYVPADSARIGIIDRIFTRIGAADDVSSGKSTFMMEMIETAQILHQATQKSLVLMDEVGRGTSTYDGLAIAWAAVKALAENIGCLTLFATHYFELTALGQGANADEPTQNSIVNYHVDATEVNGELLLLHQVKKGAANKSYGLHVATLAGVPEDVVAMANARLRFLDHQQKQVLNQTQTTEKSSENDYQQFLEADKQTALQQQQQLKIKQLEVTQGELHTLKDHLNALDPDDLTPKQALDKLYQIKALLKSLS